MKSLPFLLFFGLLMAVAPDRVQAQDQQYIGLVHAQLDAASTALREAGYEEVVREIGTLEDDATQQYTVTLNKGKTYVLMAVCDGDCLDIDLTLLDGNGQFVVEDKEVDDTPVIEFTVTASGDFTLDATMFDCEANFCYYGVVLLEE